jgi:tetratricopeptide (TPR) repeat protein
MSTCPSPETIGHFISGSWNGSRYAAMDAHVEACAACQDILERLAAESSECDIHGTTRRLPQREQPPTIPGFMIERELGRGGMGIVYQALQPQLARRVAIKVVAASALIGAEDRRRWLREARAMGRVRHPNVVRLHDAGEQDGCLYLVLDLITGGSLAERIAGPLPERVAVELTVAIARAVDQIHKAGMLHLDIKPSNILLDGPADGRWDQVTPMLADFGIARGGDEPGATATGLVGVGGTPSFMAPEQIAADRAAIGPRSDVYALGATLYSLLTGRPPFQAVSVIETLDLVRTREPAPPKTLVPGLARDLETIALSCLRKDPRRRYASAEALAGDLERWLLGFPIQARPVSRFEHACRWCRRRPAVASLVAVLILTVASFVGGLLTLWRHSEIERSRAENALAHAIESDKATSGAVRNLVGLLASSAEAPQMLVYERLVESSRVVRNLTAKLRQDRAVAASNLVEICGLERYLARDFWRRGKYSESLTLFMDAVEFLEGRPSGTVHPDVVLEYARSLGDLGWAAREQGRYDEALVLLERAEAALEDLAHDPRNLEPILSIDDVRRQIAGIFGRRGQDEAKRRLVESHIRMLERMSEGAGGDPAIGLLAALTRAGFAPDKSARTELCAAIARFPADRPIAERLKARLAVWIAKDIAPYPSDPKSPGKPPGRPDPNDHAGTVFRALESTCEALGVYPALLPAAAMEVCGAGVGRAAEQRRSGRLDDARWTSESLMAFGQALARRDPNDAASHVVLSEAFDQRAKNASRVGDVSTVETETRNALVAAWTAIRLDPRNAAARIKVAGLQDKMVGLTSRRPLLP